MMWLFYRHAWIDYLMPLAYSFDDVLEPQRSTHRTTNSLDLKFHVMAIIFGHFDIQTLLEVI